MPLTTAGLISGLTYPLRGILVLSKAPELRSKVSHFLISITATSAATSAAWLWFFYSRHVQFISQLFGMAGGSLLAHFAAGVVVLAESTLPVYLLFSRQFNQLQGQLFDATLQLQGVTISPMQPKEQQALAAAVYQLQQQRAAAKAAAKEAWRKGGLASKATQLLLGGVTDIGSFATQLLLKPQPHGEGLLVREARSLITAAAGALLPPLLPLLALRDSGAAAVRLLSKYWDRKGVPRDADSRSLVAKQRSGELRSFGLVAGTLGGLPLLNWFLGLSNMVGAALLAADMEKKRGPVFVGHASAPWGAH